MVGPGNSQNRGNNYYNRGGQGGGYERNASAAPQQAASRQPIQPKQLPENYVDEAEKVMIDIHDGAGSKITTSKIRRFLTLITEIMNDERRRLSDELLPSSIAKIQMARVRIAYEAGRDPVVKTFVDKSSLICYLKGIGNSRKDFIKLGEYVEALVAWHRYLGGKD